MRKVRSFLIASTMGIGIAVSAASWAAPVNTYQVTGPVLDVKSDVIYGPEG
jgi:hypothetical protein